MPVPRRAWRDNLRPGVHRGKHLAQLHERAFTAALRLRERPDSPLCSIAAKLIGVKDQDFLDPETIRMWASIAKHLYLSTANEADRHLFVFRYLERVRELASPPAYLLLALEERRKAAKSIAKASES